MTIWLQTARKFSEYLFSCLYYYDIIIRNYLSRRDPPEPTGDEPEDFEYESPKVYEAVSNPHNIIMF